MRFNALAQYSPMQTIQAARMGREERERDERKNAFAQAGEAYMGGDYKGAANALMPYDMGAGMQMAQYGQQQAKTAESEQLRRMYEATQLLVKEPDVMRRIQMAQGMSEGLGIPAPTDPSEYTDEVLQRELDEMRIKGGFGPEQVEGKSINNRLVNPYTGEIMGDYSDPDAPGAMSPIGQIYADVAAGILTPEQAQAAIDKQNAPRAPLVTFTDGVKPSKPPPGWEGYYDDAGEYNLRPTPGGPADQAAQGAETQRSTMASVLTTMFNSYNFLDDKDAIRDSEEGLLSNFGAYVKSSPLGQEVGKMTGSRAQAAREKVDAVIPNIVQAIMSQPGISARAFDSDKELEFFLKSVTSPKADVMANYVAIDILDQKFGTGGDLIPSLVGNDAQLLADIRGNSYAQQLSGQIDAEVNRLFKVDGGQRAPLVQKTVQSGTGQPLPMPPGLPPEVADVWDYLKPSEQAEWTQ